MPTADRSCSLRYLRLLFRHPIPVHFRGFSAFEERWVMVGQTNTGLTLTVANLFFKEDGDAVIRLISARLATPREKRQYEETI